MWSVEEIEVLPETRWHMRRPAAALILIASFFTVVPAIARPLQLFRFR